VARQWWHLANYSEPTIGAINGLVYSAAAVLASCLDIRIGCARSAFRFIGAYRNTVNSTWNLPTIVGIGRGKELPMTARAVQADEAEHIGLLNRVVSSDTLLNEAIEMGRVIAQNNPIMVRGIKQLLNENVGNE